MWQEQTIGLLCNISSRTVSLTFLLHLDVFYDQLLNKRWAAWNLFVSYDKKKTRNNVNDAIHASVLYGPHIDQK